MLDPQNLDFDHFRLICSYMIPYLNFMDGNLGTKKISPSLGLNLSSQVAYFFNLA